MKINIRNYFMLLLGLVAILFTACGNDTTDSDESMIQNSYTIDADGDFGEDVTVSKIKSLVCQAYSVQSIGNNIFLTGNAIACDAKIRDIANETVIDINNKINNSEIMPHSNYSISFRIKREDTKQIVASFSFNLKKQIYHYIYAFNKQQLSGITIELDLRNSNDKSNYYLINSYDCVPLESIVDTQIKDYIRKELDGYFLRLQEYGDEISVKREDLIFYVKNIDITAYPTTIISALRLTPIVNAPLYNTLKGNAFVGSWNLNGKSGEELSGIGDKSVRTIADWQSFCKDVINEYSTKCVLDKGSSITYPLH